MFTCWVVSYQQELASLFDGGHFLTSHSSCCTSSVDNVGSRRSDANEQRGHELPNRISNILAWPNLAPPAERQISSRCRSGSMRTQS